MSFLQIVGLPTEIGIALFVVALAATLVPSLAGTEIGSFKVPTVPENKKKYFFIAGVLGLVLVVASFFPFFSTESPENIKGDWLLIDTVDETGDAQYLDTIHRFAVTLSIRGNTVTGNAEKTSYEPRKAGEAPRNVTGTEKSQLRITGQLDGRTLNATFEEIGGKRSSNGKFLWHFQHGFQVFEGSFSSTAARTKGRSYGIKLP